MQKIDLMHHVFGYGNGKCENCQYFRQNGRIFKCAVYGETHSEASDWRKGYIACGCQYMEYSGKPIMSLVMPGTQKEELIKGQLTLF